MQHTPMDCAMPQRGFCPMRPAAQAKSLRRLAATTEIVPKTWRRSSSMTRQIQWDKIEDYVLSARRWRERPDRWAACAQKETHNCRKRDADWRGQGSVSGMLCQHRSERFFVWRIGTTFTGYSAIAFACALRPTGKLPLGESARIGSDGPPQILGR